MVTRIIYSFFHYIKGVGRVPGTDYKDCLNSLLCLNILFSCYVNTLFQSVLYLGKSLLLCFWVPYDI